MFERSHFSLAKRARSFWPADWSLEKTVSRIADRTVRLAEDLLDEELSARIARLKVQSNEEGIDPFGFDPNTSRYALTIAAFLHRKYFRTHVQGIEKLPQGRTLIVANHSGQIPIDGILLSAALVLDAEPPRLPRSMIDKWIATLPFISTLFARAGQVVGAPENAKRLLEREETLIVFPEGVRGISKTFDKRYQMTDFGLGFMRLALETKTPIVPVAIVGGEEQYVSVGELRTLAKLLHMPTFPVLPQLLIGAVLPLPTKVHLYFGEPLHFEGDADDDDSAIEEKVWVVKSSLQALLNDGLAKRRSLFW